MHHPGDASRRRSRGPDASGGPGEAPAGAPQPWHGPCKGLTRSHIPIQGRDGDATSMTFSLASLTLQQTLARAVECEGVGLHGGSTVRVRLRPSHRRPGVVVRRLDLERRLMAEGRPAKVEIVASLSGVSRVDHATTL